MALSAPYAVARLSQNGVESVKRSSIRDLLGESELGRVREPLERAWTLPPAAYTSPEVFQAEVDTLFARDWICVARVDQLPESGDYVCVDLPMQPIVVTRDSQGDLNAFSRVCLHRAMPVAEGAGRATRFVCPYHNWTYELDGRLRSAPMMEGAEGFDPAECRLPELRLEVWHGFVFVNQDQEAEPLSPQLEGLAQYIDNYDMGSLVIAGTIEFDSPWNWKLLVENFMEAYHHIGTHKDTFEPIYPARQSYVEDNGGAPWMLLRMPRKADMEEEGLPPLPRLTDEQRRELTAMAVFPTMLFAGNSSMVFWYQLEPAAHDSMRLRIHMLLPPEVRDALSESELQEIMAVARYIHVQDIAANEGPWRGLHAPMTTQGRLGPFEAAIWQLNQRWADELGL